MNYNAEHALYNRHGLFGHGVNRATKKYVVAMDTTTLLTAEVRRIGGRKVNAGDSRRAERQRTAYNEGCQDAEQDAQEPRLHLRSRQKESAPRIFFLNVPVPA